MAPFVRLSVAGCIIASPVLAYGCFREAPPCDQASFDAVAETCVKDNLSVAECAHRLDEHDRLCVRKIEAE